MKLNRNNIYEAELSREENDLIQKLIGARTYTRGLLELHRTSLGALQRDISRAIGEFALNHRLHLKKTYELVGEYPHYFIRKVSKKPFMRPETSPLPEKITEPL